LDCGKQEKFLSRRKLTDKLLRFSLADWKCLADELEEVTADELRVSYIFYKTLLGAVTVSSI
jgi:hypothetical protein